LVLEPIFYSPCDEVGLAVFFFFLFASGGFAFFLFAARRVFRPPKGGLPDWMYKGGSWDYFSGSASSVRWRKEKGRGQNNFGYSE